MSPIDEQGKILAYVMKQLMDGTEPVLKVVHDETGDWQFIGITGANSTDGRLIHPEHILEIDPSVKEVMDLPFGWQAVRYNKDKPWKRKKEQNFMPEGNPELKVLAIKDSPDGKYRGFFEDDGKSGYLYVSYGTKVINHLQIYNKSEKIGLKQNYVYVLWTEDSKKCAIVVWGGVQGVIDVEKNQEARVFMEDRFAEPIKNAEWLKGFEENIDWTSHLPLDK